MRGRLLIPFLLLTAGPLHAATALHDPTRPPSHGGAWVEEAKPKEPDWVLTSTLISPGRRLAIIDGRAVSEGDEVSGARVLQITPGGVVLRYKGKRRELGLLPATPHINVRRPVEP